MAKLIYQVTQTARKERAEYQKIKKQKAEEAKRLAEEEKQKLLLETQITRASQSVSSQKSK